MDEASALSSPPRKPRWPLLTRLAVLALCLGAFLIQIGPSRHAYVHQVEDGWRGGVRHGAPFIVWDSGTYCSATAEVLFKVEEYGGVQWGGLCANLLLLGALVYGLVALAENLRRRAARSSAAEPVRAAAPRAPGLKRIRLATAVVCCVVLLGLLGQNMLLYTAQHLSTDGKAYYTQRMGWPVTFYHARGPLVHGISFDNLNEQKPDSGAPMHVFSALTTHAVPVGRTPTAVAGLHHGFPLPPLSHWNYEWLGLDLALCTLLALVACAVSEMLIYVSRPRENDPARAVKADPQPVPVLPHEKSA